MGRARFNPGWRVRRERGKRQQHCMGCQRPIVYGDRCPPCAQLVRTRAAKRRRRR
jgi:hypothetical protein